MMFIKKLWRNGGGTICRRILCCHFSLNWTFFNHLRPTYLFLIALEKTWTFWLNSKIFSVKCKNKENFSQKNKLVLNDLKSLFQREIAKTKNISAADGGFTAVSSQFLIKHHKTTAMPNISALNSFFWLSSCVGFKKWHTRTIFPFYFRILAPSASRL